MSLSSSPASIEIRLPGVARLLLLVPVLLIILVGWFCLRWQVGATVSAVATSDEAPNLELARVAARWAPDDPFVHWQLGAAARREFTEHNLQETLREFEAAVRLSPNDFRYWEELGRALEMTGDRAGAEKALRRALFLAPNYYHPQWRLGNLLLRSNRYEEAFQHLFRAAEANQELWPQVLNLAWQAYDGDVDRIATEACKDPNVRVLFAVYLVGLKHYDHALRLWKTLTPDVRAKVVSPGRNLRKALLDAKEFRAALEVHRDLESREAVPDPEVFSNGGFEELITLPVTRPFGWTIGSNVQAKVSIINEGHGGRRSLQIVLSAANRLERINASQTIVVQPNTKYRLEFYARTDKLNSASRPVVWIFDPKHNKGIADSASLPSGTHDWQKYSIDFTMSDADGIVMMIGCPPCPVGDVCPIFGTVWYDDFILQRTSGGPGKPAAASADQETRTAGR
ncbi:MAG: carbohydrate binding domain-containing protein [Pyrinomonadaceae bacterium]